MTIPIDPRPMMPDSMSPHNFNKEEINAGVDEVKRKKNKNRKQNKASRKARRKNRR